jgi:hypothetical protein
VCLVANGWMVDGGMLKCGCRMSDVGWRGLLSLSCLERVSPSRSLERQSVDDKHAQIINLVVHDLGDQLIHILWGIYFLPNLFYSPSLLSTIVPNHWVKTSD